jgi:hypothetical protein
MYRPYSASACCEREIPQVPEIAACRQALSNCTVEGGPAASEMDVNLRMHLAGDASSVATAARVNCSGLQRGVSSYMQCLVNAVGDFKTVVGGDCSLLSAARGLLNPRLGSNVTAQCMGVAVDLEGDIMDQWQQQCSSRGGRRWANVPSRLRGDVLDVVPSAPRDVQLLRSIDGADTVSAVAAPVFRPSTCTMAAIASGRGFGECLRRGSVQSIVVHTVHGKRIADEFPRGVGTASVGRSPTAPGYSRWRTLRCAEPRHTHL